MESIDNSRTKASVGYSERAIAEQNQNINFIDDKQSFFNDVLAGEIKYTSSLVDTDK